MKKIFLTLTLILLGCVCGSAQDAVRFRNQLKENLLTFNFRYESKGKVPLIGSGTVKAQDNCYLVTSGTIEVRCNGVTKWTIDSHAKEVYIENAEDIFNFLPQLSDIREEAGRISATHKDPVNGTVTQLTISEMKSEDKIPSENFGYRIPSGKDWIVTDLRN